MDKRNIVAKLIEIANELDEQGRYTEADQLTKVAQMSSFKNLTVSVKDTTGLNKSALEKLASIANELDGISMYSEASAITNLMKRYSQAGVNLLTDSGKIKNWQNHLNKNGYTVTVDGVYGPETREATIKYQRALSLVPDGIVGQTTLRAAGLNINAPAAPGSAGGTAAGGAAGGALGTGGGTAGGTAAGAGAAPASTANYQNIVNAIIAQLSRINAASVKPTDDMKDHVIKNYLNPAKIISGQVNFLRGAPVSPSDQTKLIELFAGASDKADLLDNENTGFFKSTLFGGVGREVNALIQQYRASIEQSKTTMEQNVAPFTAPRYTPGQPPNVTT